MEDEDFTPPTPAETAKLQRMTYDHGMAFDAAQTVLAALVEIMDGSGLDASGRLEARLGASAHRPTREWTAEIVHMARAMRKDRPSRVPPPPLTD